MKALEDPSENVPQGLKPGLFGGCRTYGLKPVPFKALFAEVMWVTFEPSGVP
jgi:hypothetical protein